MSAPKSILKKPSASAGPSRVSAKVDKSGKGKSRPTAITGSQGKGASASGSKLSLSQKVEGQSKKAQKAPVASDDDMAGDEEGSEEGPKPGAKIAEESSGLDTDGEISKAKEDGSKKRKGQSERFPNLCYRC